MREFNSSELKRPPPLGGGPLGLGDPDDRRLRKTEKDIIIPKMLREEATKRCSESMQVFLECAKRTGLMVTFKCREQNKLKDECILSYAHNPDFVNEVTNKYLFARSYYRRTGEPLEKVPIKRQRSGFC